MKHQAPGTHNKVMIRIPENRHVSVIVVLSLDIIWNLGLGHCNFTFRSNKRHVYFKHPNCYKRRV